MRALLAAASLGLLAAIAQPARACTEQDWQACRGKPWAVGEMETPIGERWWPNKLWGTDDQAGSTNWYAVAEVVKRAMGEVRAGKTYSLARIGAEGELLTRLEGLAHASVVADGAARSYNGIAPADVNGSAATRKLGLEKLRPIAARGILIDVAGAKGLPALDAGYEITLADVRDALARQGLAEFRFLPGDGVFFRTGWKDAAGSSSPGIGAEVARWLSDTVQAGIVGADTAGIEVTPNADAGCLRCVHAHLLVRHGIVLQQSLDLEPLAADKAWRFLYLVNPAPAARGTSTIVAPLALR